MITPPRDCPIAVLTCEEGLWLRVRWSGQCFEVIDGDGSWVEPEEIQAWRPASWPAIGIGAPRA